MTSWIRFKGAIDTALLDAIRENESHRVSCYSFGAFYAGMRTDELIALDWGGIDPDAPAFMVGKARACGLIKSTKTDEARSILIPDFEGAEVRKLSSTFKHGALFPNQYGKLYVSAYYLNKRFSAARTNAGVRERSGPYPWRHAYVSIGLANTVKTALLARQLGDSLQMF